MCDRHESPSESRFASGRHDSADHVRSPVSYLGGSRRLRNAKCCELNYARGGGSSGGLVRDGGMTTVATAMRSGNAPASSLTVAAMARKPLAHGAITKHAVAADSWLHDDSGGGASGEAWVDISMALMSTAACDAVALSIAWCSAPGITHVVPSRASTSWSPNEKDSSRATKGERLMSS